MTSSLRVLMLMVFSLACQRPAAPVRQWNFADSIGVAVVKDEKACLSLHHSSLAPGTPLRLVEPSVPQKQSDARSGKLDPTCPETGDAAADSQRYDLAADKAWLTPATPAIAIAGYLGSFQHRGDTVSADLDGDNVEEYFRSCTSTEGVHLTVWSGKPLEGKLRWHAYYYLGYDVTPDCSPKDYETPK